ncbi:MAG: hypothetical protein KDK99_09720 [Verrucomicrobiales bacterium]|nr:hypothetical protein [Verrucomicrobiales bacterium]
MNGVFSNLNPPSPRSIEKSTDSTSIDPQLKLPLHSIPSLESSAAHLKSRLMESIWQAIASGIRQNKADLP